MKNNKGRTKKEEQKRKSKKGRTKKEEQEQKLQNNIFARTTLNDNAFAKHKQIIG